MGSSFWGSTKPPAGTPINWNSPLASGLLYANSFWAPGQEPETGSLRMVRSNGDPRPAPSFSGGGVLVDAGEAGALHGPVAPAFLKPVCDISIFCRFTPLAAAGATAHPRLFAMQYDSADSSPFLCYGFYRDASALTVTAAWNANGVLGTLSLGGVLTPQRSSDVLLTIGRDFIRYYLDGAHRLSAPGFVGQSVAYSATSRLLSGAATGAANCNLQSVLEVGYIWGRVLTSLEAEELHAAPFGLFAAPAWARFNQLSGSLGGGGGQLSMALPPQPRPELFGNWTARWRQVGFGRAEQEEAA